LVRSLYNASPKKASIAVARMPVP